jgi:hypothetical protein
VLFLFWFSPVARATALFRLAWVIGVLSFEEG